MFSTGTDTWGTPRDLFEIFHAHYQFTIDVCASPWNAKVSRYWTEREDGLSQSWEGERVWCNPPYSRGAQKLWLQKGLAELECHGTTSVFLIPARTDTSMWHDTIFPRASLIAFIRGRIRFETPNGAKDPAPFPSALVEFSLNEYQNEVATFDARWSYVDRERAFRPGEGTQSSLED